MILSEFELKNWRDRERERLCCIVDMDEWRCHRVVVAVLDGVLND